MEKRDDQAKESTPKTAVKEILEGKCTGMTITSSFAVTHMQLKEYSSGKFLQMKLGDRFGRVAAALWNEAEKAHAEIQVGDLVSVTGTVGVYNAKPQITISQITKLTDTSGIDPMDFLPAIEQQRAEACWSEMKVIARTVKDPYLFKLLTCFFLDEPFTKLFTTAPGGKQWHHGYIGGLVEHTLGVLKNVVVLAERYPVTNREALIVGAIFHDVGKILEYQYSTVIDYSDIGRLVGHQVLSDHKLCEYAARVENFPQELLIQLRHLILSHHGETEDAIKKPATREALLLSIADNLDAQMNAFTREILKARANSRKWSDFVYVIQRYLYDTGGNDEGGDPVHIQE